MIEKQSWIKISFTDTDGLTGLPKLPKKWMLIDPAKIKDKDDGPLAYDNETDPGSDRAVMQAIVDGRADRRRAVRGHHRPHPAGRGGDRRRRHPQGAGRQGRGGAVRGGVDGQGRLTSAVVKIPAAGKTKAHRYEVTYAGYGTAPTPAAPARGPAAAGDRDGVRDVERLTGAAQRRSRGSDGGPRARRTRVVGSGHGCER